MRSIFSRTGLAVTCVVITLIFMFVTKLGSFENFRISLEALFTGLLALTGFIFTARTFITFKLNEVCYGNPDYQALVENLQQTGIYNRSLYAPLKNLDSNLGLTTYLCLISLIFIVIFGCLPKYSNMTIPKGFQPPIYLTDFAFSAAGWKNLIDHGMFLSVFGYQVFSCATYAILITTMLKISEAVVSINRNIKDIIEHWEEQHTNRLKKQ